MHTRLSDNKRRGFPAVILVLWIMLASLSCAAQNGEKMPDSISTSVDSLSPVTTNTVTVTPPSSSDSVNTAGVDTFRQETQVPAEPATLRQTPDSALLAYKNDKDFSYANDPSYWVREKPRETEGFGSFLDRFFRNGAAKYLLYLLLAGLLLFALYKIIAGNNLHLFYRTPRKLAAGGDSQDGTDLDEKDLEKKIEESLRSGDHRMAVRYLFLKALRSLGEKRLIQYHPQATNQEYIGQMTSHPQGKDFLFLANAYEYIWYGDFSLNTEQYGRVEKKFQDFYNQTDSL